MPDERSDEHPRAARLAQVAEPEQTWPRLPTREHLAASPCLRLLIAVVLLLLAYPTAERWPTAVTVLLALQAFVLVASVRALGHTSARIWVGGALAAAAWLAGVGRVVYPADGTLFVFASLGLAAVFYLFVVLAFLAYVLGEGSVTFDKLYGAACVYLLMALFWAALYDLVHLSVPEAFSISSVTIPPSLRSAHLLYFSLETLTTLGYGDVRPIALEARYLAVLEATTGVLYTTILVARLIGLYRTDD